MTRFDTTAACLCAIFFVSKQVVCESTFYIDSEESLRVQRAELIKDRPDFLPILGDDPENQIHLGPQSSFGMSKALIKQTDASFFQDTGDEQGARNLGSMRLLVLTWEATTHKDLIDSLNDKEKKHRADEHIRALLKECNDSENVHLENLTPQMCFELWSRMQSRMGIGGEDEETRHKPTEKEPFATKLKRTTSKVFAHYVLPFAKRATKSVRWFFYKAAQR